MSYALFKQGAGFSRIPSDSPGTVYVTLVGTNGGDALSGLLMMRGPADRITVSQKVDATISKALSGDFIAAAFGHSLVNITINGLDLYGNPACDIEGWDASMTVRQFYDDFNMYDNKDARVDVGMEGASSEAGTAFRCVVVALDMRADHSGGYMAPGVGAYALSLVGVKL